MHRATALALSLSVLSLSFIPGNAAAQELPEGTAGVRQTRIVIVVTRYCRAGVCVRLTEYREVDDPAEESDEATAPIDDNAPAQPAPAPTCGSGDETQAWRLLNAHRARLGLEALSCDLTALKVARAHSQDMCTRSYFSHYTPEGAAPWDRLRRGGGRFSAAGENIAMGYDTAQEVHQGWLGSPGHRQNIERAGWTRAAVGLVSCSNGYKFWTQMFAR
jgi:uncharacterized protein YkwD